MQHQCVVWTYWTYWTTYTTLHNYEEFETIPSFGWLVSTISRKFFAQNSEQNLVKNFEIYMESVGNSNDINFVLYFMTKTYIYIQLNPLN